MRKFASTTINEPNKKLFRIGDFHFNLVSLIFFFLVSLSLSFWLYFIRSSPILFAFAKMAELLQLEARNSDIFATSFLSLFLFFF